MQAIRELLGSLTAQGRAAVVISIVVAVASVVLAAMYFGYDLGFIPEFLGGLIGK